MKKKKNVFIFIAIALIAIVSGFGITREMNVSKQFPVGIQEENVVKRTGGAINFTSPLLEQYNRE